MVKLVMVIDLDKCVACQACTIACKEENNVPEGVFWNHVLPFSSGKYPNVRVTFIPRPCMHCENAPCVRVYPVGARYKREKDGIVMQDYDRCIGCKYCIVACPYNVNYFMHEEPVPRDYHNPDVALKGHAPPPASKGVVSKCTFCYHLVDKGLEPACVKACPPKARYFGDLDDPESEVSRLLATRDWIRLLSEVGTYPQVYYLLR